jgi:hypothetical protein
MEIAAKYFQIPQQDQYEYFDEEDLNPPTIKVKEATKIKNNENDDGETCLVDILDTAGQEGKKLKYKTLQNTAHCVILIM